MPHHEDVTSPWHGRQCHDGPLIVRESAFRRGYLSKGGLLVGLIIHYMGEHDGIGFSHLAQEIEETGKINYRQAPRVVINSASLHRQKIAPLQFI